MFISPFAWCSEAQISFFRPWKSVIGGVLSYLLISVRHKIIYILQKLFNKINYCYLLRLSIACRYLENAKELSRRRVGEIWLLKLELLELYRLLIFFYRNGQWPRHLTGYTEIVNDRVIRSPSPSRPDILSFSCHVSKGSQDHVDVILKNKLANQHLMTAYWSFIIIEFCPCIYRIHSVSQQSISSTRRLVCDVGFFFFFSPCLREAASLPVKMAASCENFKLVYNVICNGKVPVSLYKSVDTDLSVFIAQIDGPLVNGFFCLGKCTLSSYTCTPVTFYWVRFLRQR